MTTSPILKWAGSKRRIANTVIAHFPRNWSSHSGRYIEPFCGSAAIFLALPEHLQDHAVLSDSNAELIECYAALVNDVDSVLHVLDAHVKMHSEIHYYAMREAFNDEAGELDVWQRAAAFLYLNRACFNGLWRTNKEGAMNVPWGKAESVQFDAGNVRAAAKALSRAKILACDYHNTMSLAGAGDLVYIDSPYDGTFSSYTSAGFRADDQRELAVQAKALARGGVHVLMSNSDTDLIRELYRDFHISEISAPRSISRDGEGRKKVTELLISSYRPSCRVGGDAATHGQWYTETLDMDLGGEA